MSQAKTVTDYLNLQKKIEAGQFAPITLLQGDTSHFIDELCDAFEKHALQPAERSFNQSILFGKEVKMLDLISMARRYPMMSRYQLIIVKEAQNLKDWDSFLSYAEKPVPTTILVFCYKGGKMDMRSKTAKAIQKYSVFTSDKLRDYQIKEWLPLYAETKGKHIDKAAVEMLVELLGDDLSLIHNELSKVLINVKEQLIRVNHITENVVHNRDYNVFELQNAIGTRNTQKVLQIAHHMAGKNDRGELPRSVATLYGYFSKIVNLKSLQGLSKSEIAKQLGVVEFFVGDYMTAAGNFNILELENALNHLKTLDLKIKGVHRGSATDRELFIDTMINVMKRA